MLKTRSNEKNPIIMVNKN